MFVLCLCVATIVVFYVKFVRPLSYWKKLGVKQTDPIPVFGDSLRNILGEESIPDFSKRIYNVAQDERYSGFYQVNKPGLCIRNPELIKQIMVKDFDYFTDHQPLINPDVDPLWGKNLFTMGGKKWREMRLTLSPSFTSSKMKFMYGLINEAAQKFAKYFLNQNKDTIDVELKDTICRFTNDMIATTAFGVEVDSLKEKDNEFYLMGIEATTFTSIWVTIKFFSYMLVPKLMTMFKIRLFSSKVYSFFYGLITTTLREREKNKIIRPDMIHLLKEARKETQEKLTDWEITAQALVFFFAGFESVAGATCFALYELAVNQEVQDKLREEIIQTFEENDGELTYDVLQNMKYMDMVVQETLRKWPPFANVDRMCTKPYTIQPTKPNESPIPLKPNDKIIFPVFGLQRDPKYFPNPEKFDPERFSEKNKDKIVPYSFITFGGGPRYCIGNRFALLEIKIILFYLLKQFKIVPNEKSEIPVQVHPRTFSTTPKNGFYFSLKKIVN